MTPSEKTILVVYPYKFTENYYRKFEIELLKEKTNVVAWDIGYWVHPKFVRALSAPSSERSCIVRISSLWDLFRAVRQLGPKKWNEVVAFPVSRPQNLKELICTLMVKWRASTRVEFLNQSAPSVNPIPQPSGPKALRKITSLLRVLRKRGFRGALGVVEWRVTRILSNWLSIRPTHRLLAGTTMEEQYEEESKRQGISIVPGLVWDLSNALAYPGREVPTEIREPYAVLLDGAGPAHASDSELHGDKPILTKERWYPALVNCFDRWERELGVRIVVAGHPKGRFEDHPQEFGYRRVYYGCTEELVKYCEFAIMRFSDASSYAVFYNKPIICIYNEQMRANGQMLRSIQEATKTLGVTPINLDDPPTSISDYLRIDVNSYRRYKENYLTTVADPKPIYRILLEDIMSTNERLVV